LGWAQVPVRSVVAGSYVKGERDRQAIGLMIKEISVFLPAYNDGKTIGKLVLDAISVLDPLGLDYEIIIIDDCSRDETGEIVRKLAADNKRVKWVRHTENRDYGGVLKSGFTHATKKWVFYTDGDGQYDIKEMTRLLPFAEEYDLVNGYILKRQDSFYRIVASKIYQLCLDRLFGKTLTYINCDFRLIRKEAVDQIKIHSNSGFAPAEMVIRLVGNGVKLKEVLVSHFPRRYGRSQFLNLKKMLHLLRDMATFLVQK
jgi:glycosyltransferase involved in cell wall biosynthesis